MAVNHRSNCSSFASESATDNLLSQSLSARRGLALDKLPPSQSNHGTGLCIHRYRPVGKFTAYSSLDQRNRTDKLYGWIGCCSPPADLTSGALDLVVGCCCCCC